MQINYKEILKLKSRNIVIVLMSLLLAAGVLSGCGNLSKDPAGDSSLMSLYDRAGEMNAKGDYEKSAETYAATGHLYSPSMSESEKIVCIDALRKAGLIYIYYVHSRIQGYLVLREAVEMSEKEGIDRYLPVIYTNLGNIYNNFTDPYSCDKWSDRAFEMYSRGFDSSLKLKDWRNLSTNVINLCEMYTPSAYASSKSRKAERLNEIVRTFLATAIPDDVEERNYARYFAGATLEMLRGNYRKALELYRCAYIPSNVDSLKKRYMECQRIDNISRVYECSGIIDSAIYLQKQILAKSIRDSLPEIEAYTSLSLSRLYEKSDRDASRELQLRYFVISDSLRMLNDHNTMGEMELQYRLGKEKNSLEESRNRENIRNIVIVFCAVILLICLVFIFFLLRKHRRLAQRNDLLYQKNMELVKTASGEQQNLTDKYSSSSISDEDKVYLSRKIEEALASDRVLSDPDLSVSSLAASLKSNKSYVSQVINEHYGINFRTLVGNLRVKEVLRKIDADPRKYSNITVDGLALEAGFKSRATFTLAFRRVTGLPPAEFLKIARRRHGNKKSEPEESSGDELNQ